MVQSLFDVYQTKLEIGSNLYMPSWQREVFGERFIVTLMVEMDDNGATAPFDIYVNRLLVGDTGIVHRAVDGAAVIATVARIELGDDEEFNIEFTLEKGNSPAANRPHVRVSDDMVRLIRERQEAQARRVIEEFLTGIDNNPTTEQTGGTS